MLDINEEIKAVKDGFRLTTCAKAVMPTKLYLDLPEHHGNFRAMPAYIDGMAGEKWVSV